MNDQIKHAALILLLLSILLTALAPAAGAADPAPRHTLDQALLLMVSAELWATGGGAPVEASAGPPGFLSLAANPRASARQTQVAINAVKEVIALKQAAFADSHAMLEGHVSPETLQAHEDAYVQQVKQLNNTLEDLRREWRRQQRFWPKLTRPFKQAGAWFWHQIGPAGRQILRLVGDDLVELVIAGDPVTGKAVRLLIVKHARAVGREKAKAWLSRLLLGRQPDETGTQGEGGETEELSWEAFWDEVYAGLVEQGLHCNRNNILYYQQCLQAAAQTADSWESVLESCASERAGLRGFPAQASLEDTEYFHRDGDNYLSLQYDIASGEVSGRYVVDFVDYGAGQSRDPGAEFCTVTMGCVFSGRISAADCSLAGSSTWTTTTEGGFPCVFYETSVGTREVAWEAELDRGHINGNVCGLAFDLDLVEHAR